MIGQANDLIDSASGLKNGSEEALPDKLDQYLQQPFLAKTKNGLIKKFFVSRDEPFAVTNLKRTLLHDLQQVQSGILFDEIFNSLKANDTFIESNSKLNDEPLRTVRLELIKQSSVSSPLEITSSLRSEYPFLRNSQQILTQELGAEAMYNLEVGVTYGGENIGNCGSYKTRAELETACTIDYTCIGYSTIRDHNTGAVAENGFYPWCLKKTEGQMKIQPSHNYYRKNPRSEYMKQLIESISKKSGVPKELTGPVLDAFLEIVISKIAEGDKVSIKGFGAFERRERAARFGRNPKTGNEIWIPAAYVPVFKAGKRFKDAMPIINANIKIQR